MMIVNKKIKYLLVVMVVVAITIIFIGIIYNEFFIQKKDTKINLNSDEYLNLLLPDYTFLDFKVSNFKVSGQNNEYDINGTIYNLSNEVHKNLYIKINMYDENDKKIDVKYISIKEFDSNNSANFMVQVNGDLRKIFRYEMELVTKKEMIDAGYYLS